MQVRLGFAVATAMKPDVLLLDEVLAVGDVGFQVKCFNALAELRKKGVPFILVSHNMQLILRYCEKVVYLSGGRVDFIGDVEEGVSRFMAEMDQDTSNRGGNNWEVANGSGGIVMRMAHFEDEDRKVVSKINPTEPFSIVVRFHRERKITSEIAFNLTIRNKGTQLYHTSIRGAAVNRLRGASGEDGELRIWFENMPLNCGSVDFYFSFMNVSTNEIYDWRRDLRLNLSVDSSVDGMLLFNPKIQIK
jgi:energy-coupling factor transporter ATP-binding protein EcfA2